MKRVSGEIVLEESQAHHAGAPGPPDDPGWDNDIVEDLKNKGSGSRTRIHAILRSYRKARSDEGADKPGILGVCPLIMSLVVDT
jgi:hypothetical protein